MVNKNGMKNDIVSQNQEMFVTYFEKHIFSEGIPERSTSDQNIPSTSSTGMPACFI